MGPGSMKSYNNQGLHGPTLPHSAVASDAGRLISFAVFMKRKGSFDDKRVAKRAKVAGGGSGFASSDRSFRPVASHYARPEVKYLQGSLNTTAAITGTVAAFNVPSVGTANTERIGSKYKVINFQGNWAASVGDQYNLVRLMIFQWRPDSNLDSPSLAKLFEHTSLPHISCYVAEKRARKKFKVLYDRTVATSTNGPEVLVSNIAIRGDQIAATEIEPATSTGTNKLFYCVVSDSVAVTHPGIILSAVYYFEDS